MVLGKVTARVGAALRHEVVSIPHAEEPARGHDFRIDFQANAQGVKGEPPSREVEGWTRVAPPQVADGASVFGIKACAPSATTARSATNLPDYAYAAVTEYCICITAVLIDYNVK